MRENKKCRECDKLNRDYCYPTAPPKFDCKVTGQCHLLDDVCDVKEEMDKQDEPRLAEVLGVEVGEKFRIRNFTDNGQQVTVSIDSSGLAHTEPHSIAAKICLLDVINHPESIIRLPRLTEREIAIMRAVGAKWVSRDENCDDGSVDLWMEKPLYGDGMYNNTCENGLAATIHNSALFSSVNPGDCIKMEDTE